MTKKKANEEKIKSAKQFLEAHPDHGELEDKSIISDILADLKHYAERHNIDFEKRLMIAEKNYKNEREEIEK